MTARPEPASEAASPSPAADLIGGDLAWLRALVALMEECDLGEVAIEERGRSVRLSRAIAPRTQAVATAAPEVAAPANRAAVPAAAALTNGDALPAGIVEVSSPMVGTFYLAQSPDAAPFVEIGDAVSEDTTLCIIEAMKVMNEIKAEIEGSVVEILIANGEAVEYGQPLVRIRTTA